MTRVTEEEFEGKEVSRIYVAGSVREAEVVERLLDRNGIDYLIEIEEYRRLTLLLSPTSKGVAFYVLDGQADHCKALLKAKRMLAGLVDG